MKERSFTISTNGAVSANVGAHNPYHDCVVLVTYRRGRNSFYISLSQSAFFCSLHEEHGSYNICLCHDRGLMINKKVRLNDTGPQSSRISLAI